METGYFLKALCKQEVKTFLLSTPIALNVKFLPLLKGTQGS